MKKTLALLSLAACVAGTAIAQDNDFHGKIKRVLLISIDGMHAVDFANCVNGITTVNNGAPYCPALAALGKTGINYVAASTSKPSDSFPGLTSIVTGGSPALTGIYYDVAYSRALDGPAVVTGNGNGPGPCTAGAPPTGFTTEYEEGIDIDQTKVNGGAPGASLTDGGIRSIDPQKLDRDPAQGCKPVWPWQFVRANTIFSVIHAAGVSPSQAAPETILKVDLYGTALVLEEFSKVIAEGGAGIVIASQSGHRLPPLSTEQNHALATTPVEELLKLPMLQPDQVNDSLHAYQLSKRGNSLRVMFEAVRWGKRGARVNTISPGIIMTPLAKDELTGPRGAGYRRMIEGCPAKRTGTPDEVGNVAALLMGPDGAFITGSDFLMDGGVTSSYWFGELAPT